MNNIINLINDLENQTILKFSQATTKSELKNIKASVLGKNGKLTEILQMMRSLPRNEIVEVGKRLNHFKLMMEYHYRNNDDRIFNEKCELSYTK